MTHESILSLVDQAQSGVAADRIFIRPLADNVDFALVWDAEPAGRSANESNYRFYFVRDESGKYVGAVEDLVGDIHAVTKAEHRRKGIMTRALVDVVLPHIFSQGRTVQCTRICSPEGRALALKIGFRPLADDWAEISETDIRLRTLPTATLPPLDAIRSAAVSARIRTAAKCMRDAAECLRHRAGAKVIEQLEFAACSIDSLVDGDRAFTSDFDDPPQPTLASLDDQEEGRVESLIYQGAGWLRIVADELDGRGDDARVDGIRKLASRVIETGHSVRDDWQDRQFRAFAASRAATSGADGAG